MWGKFIKAIFTGRHVMSPWTWIVGVVVLGYAIWPVDAIPDYITGPFGVLDDLGAWGVLAGMMRWELSRFEKASEPSVVETTAERVD